MQLSRLALLCLLPLMLLFSACEQVVVSGEDTPGEQPGEQGSVRFVASVAGLMTSEDASEQTHAVTSLSEVATRISYAFFRADGSLIVAKQQMAEDAGFGTLSTDPPADAVRVVAIAHSGEGAPSFKSVEEVKFASNKVTETYYAVQNLATDGREEYVMPLAKATALIRTVIFDAMPAGVARMKFYYTGGSSTFNPMTGYGCVDSRQTEEREVTDAMRGQATQFEVYTLPHSDGRTLRMEISALDASGTALYQRTLPDVPVQRGEVTQYECTFFDGEQGGGSGGNTDGGLRITLRLISDDGWTQMDRCY